MKNKYLPDNEEQPIERHAHKQRHGISHTWWGTLAGKATALIAILASIASIVAAVPIVASYFRTDPPRVVTELQRTPELGLEFWEGGTDNQYPMTTENRKEADDTTMRIIHVTAKSAPFEIRFPTISSDDRAGMHICAWTDDSIFNVKDGTDFSDWSDGNMEAFDSPFVPAKGIANTTSGNAVLPLTNKYNSYWVEDRVDRVSDTKDRIFISKASGKGSEGLLADRKENLYMTFWMDRDRSNSIEFGEYEYIAMSFAK